MTEPGDEDPGRLLGALQEWARQTFPPPAAGMGGSTCEWCPLCQFMAVVRGERPELTERVTEAGAAVFAALKGVLDAATPPPSRPRPRPHPPVAGEDA